MSFISGAVANCHLAVIPSIRFERTELRNVAVLVIDDKDFYVGPAHFQMEAILGYPALAALGRITFHADGRFEARPSVTGCPSHPPQVQWEGRIVPRLRVRHPRRNLVRHCPQT